MKSTSRAVEHWVWTAAATVALGVAASPSANALGLGRLAVQSAIGESLRAEVDITSLTPEEAANLQVRIAPPESYRSAGVDYNAVLPGTQATVMRRADGRAYVRLTSDRSVLEPFVDVILEVSWSSGRMVREYTLLFDPPTQRNVAAAAPAPVLPAAEAPPPPSPAALAAAARAAAASVPSAPVATVTPAPAEVGEPRAIATRPPVTARAAPVPPTAAAPVAPRPSTASAGPRDAVPDSYTVHRGDTLSRIAARTQRPGVSLDQMLVSLYQGNPDAFVGANMNRLKSGAVLGIPSADTANAIQPDVARQTIQAQSADFGAYRQRLASGALPTRTEGSSRQASGSVQARVEDHQKSASAANDKLTLTKNAASAAATAAADDAISKQKERQASKDRLAELNKNVSDLARLSAAASAAVPVKLARAASAVAASAAAPAVVLATPAPPAPSATRLAIAVPVPSPPIVASTPTLAPTPAPLRAVPASSAVAASAVAVAAAASPAVPMLSVQPPVRAAASAPAPEPAPQPSSDGGPSWWSDTPWLLPLAGVLAVALAGIAFWRARRRPRVGDVGETSFLESRLQPDSFFGASGGQRIDTHEASGGVSSSMTYSLSQLDAIGDVDPVAEADVYLAYGRDLQAEEILKEAMRGNPERLAIRTKLLEVYAKRRDTKGFEMLATQMFKLTGGTGEDWDKAQEIGAQIDPDNPLYQVGGVPPAPMLGDAERTIELLGASTMPQSVLPSPSQYGADDAADEPFSHAHAPGIDLNLDLDFADATAPHHVGPDRAAVTGLRADDDLSDFLGSAHSPDSVDSVPSVHGRFDDEPETAADVGFLSTEVQPPNAPPLRPAPTGAMSASVPESMSPPAPAADAPLEFDLSSISLDLDPEPPPPAAEVRELDLTPTAAGELFEEDDGADPLERKLDLAQEFHQIGDLEGARELLQEVMDRANGGLKDRAQRLLHDMGV